MSVAEAIELDVELPGNGDNVWYYPPGGKGGVAGMYGRTAKIRNDHGKTWYGVFANGDDEGDGLWQFKADPKSFVILQRGAGYHVQLDDPSRWKELPKFGFVRFAKYVEAKDILILFDFIEAVGYGSGGEVWRSPRLFLDDLEVVSANDDTIDLTGSILDSKAPDYIGKASVTLAVRDGAIIRGRSFSWEDQNLYGIVPAGSDAR